MSNRNDDSWIIYVVGGGIAFIAYVVWQFSTFFGLDMNTGGSVFARLVGLAGLLGVCLKFGDDYEMLRFRKTWALFLALFWSCWWPALDYWASLLHPSFYTGDVTIWWDAWYSKLAVLLCIGGLGYWDKTMLEE